VTKQVLCATLVLLVLLSFPLNLTIAQASTIDPTVSVNTGDVNLAFGVKAKIVYEASVSVSKPASAQPGEVKKWDIQIGGGTLSVSVYVPSPISKWYTASKSVPIGSYVDIPVTTGISARVKVISSTQLSVSGPASLDMSSLSWESEGTKSTSVNIPSDAHAGQTVTVGMNFKFPIYVGVVIDLLLFKKEIASTNIGAFSATPTLSESMSIGAPPLEVPLNIIMVAVVALLIIAVVGYAVYRHRRISQSSHIVSTSTHY